MSAALTSGGLQVGWAWRTSAAIPATWGDAMDVPLFGTAPSPVPTPAEMMLSPGAEMSGLTPGERVPRDVKLDGRVLDVSGSVSSNWRRSSPAIRITRVPASMAGRSSVVADRSAGRRG